MPYQGKRRALPEILAPQEVVAIFAACRNLRHRCRRTPKVWKVYVRAPLGGPAHVVRYLSRYVQRIAIANSRITHYDGQNTAYPELPPPASAETLASRRSSG